MTNLMRPGIFTDIVRFAFNPLKQSILLLLQHVLHWTETNGKQFCLDLFNRNSTSSSTKPFWVWSAPKMMKKPSSSPKTPPRSQGALQVPRIVWNPWCNHSNVCMQLLLIFSLLLLLKKKKIYTPDHIPRAHELTKHSATLELDMCLRTFVTKPIQFNIRLIKSMARLCTNILLIFQRKFIFILYSSLKG